MRLIRQITNFRLALFLTAVFFFTAFLTLKDYGVSWDEAVHYGRGQIYLNYFLTGNKEYSEEGKKSFYQFDYYTGDYFFKGNVGHPPVSGILASLSNYIFYQKLEILSDIASYHLFNIFASSVLVFVTTVFMARTFGIFPSIIAFLALVTYPLFWAESHFNVKDPALSAFFAGFIWTFYESLTKRSYKWLIASFVFLYLALGTKFNTLFLPFIIFPWAIIVFAQSNLQIKEHVKSFSKKYLFILMLGPVFVILALTASWPYLWESWPKNIFNVVTYYKQVGTGFQYQPERFYLLGFNTFPLQWIIFTTHPLVLILTFIGIISAWTRRNLFNGVTILWLLWLVVPIARVSVPGSNIYGGVRQIMEFIPALALLAGLGTLQVVEWLKVRKAGAKIFLILVFLWPIYVLFKLHPQENVYFNSLIGGLAGAKAWNFPSWGNSYGNAYLAGINWLNKNAPENSKVSLVQGLDPNAPEILLRSDINLSNYNWSGINRGGEYLMELNFNDTGKAFYYAWEYIDKFLIPVYEEKVDGIAILKIWKNDLQHTKPEFRLSEKVLSSSFSTSQENNQIRLDLGREYLLSRAILSFIPEEGCKEIGISFVDTSLDGTLWNREKDWISFPQVANRQNLDGDTINYYFAARQARFVRFWFDSLNSCGLKNPSAKITVFD